MAATVRAYWLGMNASHDKAFVVLSATALATTITIELSAGLGRSANRPSNLDNLPIDRIYSSIFIW